MAYSCVRAKDKSIISVVVTGGVSGILVSACVAIFTYLHRVPELSFGVNISYSLMNEYLVPVVLLYAIYFLLTRDDVQFKIKAFFPLMGSFYAVYMPYRIFSSTEGAYSFFQLFVKPLVVLSFVMYVCKAIFELTKAIKEKKVLDIVLSSVLGVISFLVPAAIETIYLVTVLPVLVYGVSAFYVLSAAVFFFIESRREDRGFLL